MKGPPITIRCDCGESRAVAYGETWQCETCGRRWNTAQIPPEDYQGIVRDVRRLRLAALAGAVVIVAAGAVLALVVSESLVLVAIALLAVWYFWFGPFYRKRVRRRARTLPTWDLRPE